MDLDGAYHVPFAVHEGDGGAAEARLRDGCRGEPDQGTVALRHFIHMVAIHGPNGRRPGKCRLAGIVAHLQIGRHRHHGHAQGRVAHQGQMHPVVLWPLPTAVLRGVQGLVVHGGPSAVADVVAHAHVLEVPVGHARPNAGEPIPAGDGGAEEIIRYIPITEIAAHGHVEHATEIHGRIPGGGSDVVGVVPPTASTGIGPQIALAVHEGAEGLPIGVAIGDIGGAHQR